METQEQRRALEQELQKIKGTYTQGTEVVVNVDGDWVRGKLTANSEPEGSTLKLQVEYDRQGHALTAEKRVEIETTEKGLQLKDAPKIIKYAGTSPPPTPIVSHGETYRIDNLHITEKGGVEYNLTANTGEKTIGVPQEFIDLWQENIQLDARLATLQTEINKLGASKQLLLIEKNKEIQKTVAEIFSALPDVGKMNKRDRTQIEKLQADLGKLLKDAGEALKKLEKEVTDMNATGSGASTEKYHVKTTAEKEQDGKEQENLKKHAEELRRQIDIEVARRLTSIDDTQKDALEKKIEEAEVAHKKAVSEWEADKKNKTNPGKFEKKSVELTRKELADFEDKKKKAVQDAYKTYLDKTPANPFDQQIIDLVVNKRKEKAKSDTFATIGVDLKTIGTPPQVDDYNQTSSKYAEANVEILDKVLAGIIAGTVEEEKVPDDKELFDFDAKFVELKPKIVSLIEVVPDDTTGTAYDYNKKEWEGALERFEKMHDDLQTLEKAIISNKLSAGSTLDDLKTLRVSVIELMNNTVEADLLAKAKEEAKTAVKNVESKLDEKENKDAEPVIDIPEYLMRELLKQREGEVRIAVHTLFKGGVERAENGSLTITPEASTQFKNIFGDTQPANTPEIADIMAKLRGCGIKDWKQFKKIWDEQLAAQSMGAMHEMATALVRRNVAENITWRDKLNKNLGQIITRAGISIALVGGAAFGASLLAASGGLLGLGVAVAGGTAGGVMRGAVNRLIFDKWNWMKKRQEKNQQELETEKETSVVDELTNQLMAGVLDAGTVGKDSTGTTKIDGLPSFAAIMAQGIRDLTTEIKKLNESEPDEAKKLGGNARLLYEQALAHLDTKNPDAEQKRQLAIAISKMNGQGEKNFEAIRGSVDAKIMGVLEKAVGTYSGKSGIGVSALMGGVVGGAFFENSVVTRAVLGGVFGGVAGFKEGVARDMAETRRSAKERVYADITSLRNASVKVLRDNVELTNTEKNGLQEPLTRLKRLLHVNVSDPSELAVYGIARTDDRGDLVDHVGNVVVTKDGEIKNPELRALMQDLRATVRDAERSGILHEEKEERMKMDKVLETMKGHGDKIEEKYTEGMSAKQRSWWQRNKNKVKFGVGGVVGGAAAAVLLGYGAKAMVEHVKKDWLHIDDIEGTHHHDMSHINDEAKAAALAYQVEHPPAPVPAPVEPAPTAHEAHPAGPSSTEAPQPHKPTVFSEATIQKGEGVLNGLNDFQDAKPDMTNWGDDEKAAWAEFSQKSDTEFSAWKMEQLKEMGFVWKGGRLGYPFTVHPGAEMKLYLGDDGDFHARFEDNGKVSMHDKLHFRGPRVVAQTVDSRSSDTQTIAKSVSSDDVVRKGFASQKYIHIEPNMVEGIIENIHHIKGNAVVLNVEPLSSNKALVKFSDGTTYEVVKARGSSDEFRGKYIPDTRLQTNVNRLLQVLPKGEDTTRLSQADRIITDLQKKYDHVEINNAKMDENNKLILEMSYHQKEGDLIHSGNRTEKMVIQDVVRSSQRNIPMTNIGGTIHDMFMRPGEKITSVEGVSGELDALKRLSTSVTPSARNFSAKVGSDRSGIFAEDFLKKDGVGRGVDSSTDKINPPAEKTQTSSGQNVEQTVSDSPDASTENLAQWNSWLDSYKETPAVNLDQYGTVVKEMAEAVLQKVNTSPETLSPQAKMVLNSYEDPIKMIRSLSDVFAKDGSFSNLGLEEKLFIGGTHVQDPAEFMKVKVLSQDGTGYAGDAYVPINNGIPASKYAAIKFDDDRGYRFFSSKDSTYGVGVDKSGKSVLMEYTDNPDDGTIQVSPVLLANKW